MSGIDERMHPVGGKRQRRGRISPFGRQFTFKDERAFFRLLRHFDAEVD